MQSTVQPNAFYTVWLFAKFELTRLLFTKRGLFLLASLATVWFFILDFLIYESVQLLRDPLLREQISSWFGEVQLDYLLQWPYSELAVYWLIGVFIFPFMAILMSSDQIASDIKRGTVRFLLLRSTRSQLLLGRFFGKTLIITILIILSVLATLAMGVNRDASQIVASIPQLALIIFNLLLLSLPYIALMSLLNAYFQSSKLSLLFAFIILPLISSLLGYFTTYLQFIDHLFYVLPGVQLTDTIQLADFHFSSLLIPLLQTIGYLLLTRQVLVRKSL